MPIACVVLDLDGTLTDVSREAPAFSAAFTRLLADLLGKDLSRAWPEEERRVRALAPELAWIVEGHAVGPADADPYILASCTAQLLFDRLLVLGSDPALRSEIITAVFRRAYRETRAAFRPDAERVLEALLDRGLPVHVITNADTDVAAAKLGTLAPRIHQRLRVRGDARKFLIAPPARSDDRWNGVPAERCVPDLSRPLLLGRGRYYDALAAIWAETGTLPGETLVCGDIFELDLALPAELGAHVHLVRRERTHAYELSAVSALGARGGVSDGLVAILDRLA
jgi:phosphoglycolate phosphatase-like HAD superfamily hydrolase